MVAAVAAATESRLSALEVSNAIRRLFYPSKRARRSHRICRGDNVCQRIAVSVFHNGRALREPPVVDSQPNRRTPSGLWSSSCERPFHKPRLCCFFLKQGCSRQRGSRGSCGKRACHSYAGSHAENIIYFALGPHPATAEQCNCRCRIPKACRAPPGMRCPKGLRRCSFWQQFSACHGFWDLWIFF